MSRISCTLLPGGAFSVFHEGRMELSGDFDVSIIANESIFTLCCFALLCLGGESESNTKLAKSAKYFKE